MRSTILLFTILFAAPALAFDQGQEIRRVLVQMDPDDRIAARICASLREALDGTERPVDIVSDDLRHHDRRDVRWIVRVDTLHSRIASTGGIGVGIGNAGIYADLDLLQSEISARIEVIDPASLAILRSYRLSEQSVRPGVSGMGIGGRYGFIRIPSRLGRQRALAAAAEALGDRIATHLIAESFPEDDTQPDEI